MVRRYTKEFKEEAVKLVTEQGYTQSAAAKGLGINSKNIYRWITETKVGVLGKKRVLGSEQEELIRLRKENSRLKMEQEILKKAAAFFAKDHI